MKDIEFTYLGEHSFNVCEKPQPSKTYLPDWFINMPPYAPSEKNPRGNKIIVENHDSNATAKKCTPMLDAMITGYTVPLWSDVQVRQEENGPRITWKVSQDVFGPHGNWGAPLIPPPLGYDNVVFKFNTSFRIRTPKGYSVIIRNVAGHNGLPFYAIPAIIDTDKSVIDTNIPVWVRSGFDGIVEKGTPMAQIIPFKRDNWKATFTWITEEQMRQEDDKGFASTIVNNYVKNIWSRKKFI